MVAHLKRRKNALPVRRLAWNGTAAFVRMEGRVPPLVVAAWDGVMAPATVGGAVCGMERVLAAQPAPARCRTLRLPRNSRTGQLIIRAATSPPEFIAAQVRDCLSALLGQAVLQRSVQLEQYKPGGQSEISPSNNSRLESLNQGAHLSLLSPPFRAEERGGSWAGSAIPRISPRDLEPLAERSADSHVREFLWTGSRGQGCPRSGQRLMERV